MTSRPYSIGKLRNDEDVEAGSNEDEFRDGVEKEGRLMDVERNKVKWPSHYD